ncbi:hypothetical protein RRG08_066715 [Elysia crispata]|uniref:Uncharacterized protein n=1 Tax=Elysia crispata TaxID=231223 RepID=A0AAE1ECD4_9GAST|nr:hypothetical protein RRG08_066715 [Elysia crispata]
MCGGLVCPCDKSPGAWAVESEPNQNEGVKAYQSSLDLCQTDLFSTPKSRERFARNVRRQTSDRVSVIGARQNPRKRCRLHLALTSRHFLANNFRYRACQVPLYSLLLIRTRDRHGSGVRPTRWITSLCIPLASLNPMLRLPTST